MNTNDTGREPTDAEPRNCHDCGAMPGQYHMDGCDVERCPECGGQRISCDCDLPGPHRALPWTGEWPGKAEAREFGWFSRFVDGHGWVRCDKNEAGASPDLNRLVAEAVWDADAGRFVLSGARPMPDLIHEDELPEMTNAEYAAWYEKSFIPGGVGCRVGPRHMPDTPAPSTDDPVCGATTRVDGKFRTCELPNGHTSDHRTTLRGIEISWPVDEPNAPVIGSNQCEHGHLARVCVTCELIAAEARIADLERENAALGAELAEVKVCAKMLLDLHFLGGSSGEFNAAIDRLYKCITPAGSAGKEAPYAE